MVGAEKVRRLRKAAEAWLAANPRLEAPETRFDVAAERDGELTVLTDAF
jgi:Holliday junction resolvase-like predicted endonuclease